MAVAATESLRCPLYESTRDCFEPLLELHWLRRFWSELFMVNEVSAFSRTRGSTIRDDRGDEARVPARDITRRTVPIGYNESGES